MGNQTINSACQASGHCWRRSTADGYRHCSNGCGAIERLQAGEWVRVDVERTKKRRAKQTETLYDLFGGIDVRAGEKRAGDDLRNYWR